MKRKHFLPQRMWKTHAMTYAGFKMNRISIMHIKHIEFKNNLVVMA